MYSNCETLLGLEFVGNVLASQAWKNFEKAERELMLYLEEKYHIEDHTPLNQVVAALGRAVNKFTVVKFLDWKAGSRA